METNRKGENQIGEKPKQSSESVEADADSLMELDIEIGTVTRIRDYEDGVLISDMRFEPSREAMQSTSGNHDDESQITYSRKATSNMNVCNCIRVDCHQEFRYRMETLGPEDIEELLRNV